ncbi:MAG: sporulation protein YtfJ [Ruminococcaceae bacterium]|nr:sporulation protein YtfJ [Oscillospiraceae bacterium]
MSETNKINEIIKTSVDSIKEFADSNTVFGEPITTPNGTTVIPISKISIGFATGGVDYFGKNAVVGEKEKMQNFGGGGGTGVTISPVGFLVVKASGDVQMLNIKTNESVSADSDIVTTINTILEKSPEIIGKIKSFFKKDNSAEEETEESSEE